MFTLLPKLFMQSLIPELSEAKFAPFFLRIPHSISTPLSKHLLISSVILILLPVLEDKISLQHFNTNMFHLQLSTVLSSFNLFVYFLSLFLFPSFLNLFTCNFFQPICIKTITLKRKITPHLGTNLPSSSPSSSFLSRRVM